ncbi:hypothetical protein FVE85_1682 [Porphyridium purpureum]|uniref:rRNA-processing protein FYV7 n=1 Tax=Porphyridium purpureum TaxID=35688 RepID=A0A5J4YYI8_PORPP|nr:hypothetical protein FVE85_1682 [Porphyridium purpureum]|eukprot:POR7797..scf209_3
MARRGQVTLGGVLDRGRQFSRDRHVHKLRKLDKSRRERAIRSKELLRLKALLRKDSSSAATTDNLVRGDKSVRSSTPGQDGDVPDSSTRQAHESGRAEMQSADVRRAAAEINALETGEQPRSGRVTMRRAIQIGERARKDREKEYLARRHAAEERVKERLKKEKERKTEGKAMRRRTEKGQPVMEARISKILTKLQNEKR